MMAIRRESLTLNATSATNVKVTTSPLAKENAHVETMQQSSCNPPRRRRGGSPRGNARFGGASGREFRASGVQRDRPTAHEQRGVRVLGLVSERGGCSIPRAIRDR